jgi:hypothetical protein
MHCPACKANYGLYTQDYSDKGIAARYRGWARRTLLLDLSAATENLEKEKGRLTDHARTEFRERWNKHFSGKTKKAAWRELTDDGKSYPSLPTFYTHIRESSLEQVLERYFECGELPTVVRILRLNGSDLETSLTRVQRLEEELKRKDHHAREEAFI